MGIAKNSICLFVISFLSIQAFAQDEDCELTLTRATDEFNAGHFYAIPSILNNCLSKFTREQRQRANILLTQTYLLLDDPIGAKRSYLEVLKANPEFVTDEKIHAIDVVYLSKKFTSAPVFSWLVKGGSNVTPIRNIYEINAFGQQVSDERYALRLGYQIGFGGDFYFNENLGLRAEANFSFTAYTHKTLNYFDNDKKEIYDRQNWIGIPVMLQYVDHLGKYRPYGYAGYSVNLLLKDVANVTITKVGVAEDNTDKESPDIDLMHKRNNLNQSILVGGGIKYKLGFDFLFVDLRYSFGLKNMVDGAGLYADYSQDRTSDNFVDSFEPTSFAHVDDYFRMDNVAISIGFIRPLYKPRELKRAKTKSVLHRIKSKKQ